MRLGHLESIDLPDGRSRHGLEPVCPTERSEPGRAEGKEDGGCVAERHTAGDAQGVTSGVERDGRDIAEQESGLAPARPDYLQAG